MRTFLGEEDMRGGTQCPSARKNKFHSRLADLTLQAGVCGCNNKGTEGGSMVGTAVGSLIGAPLI